MSCSNRSIERLAYSNHVTYLSVNWEEENKHNCIIHVTAYVAGIFEHIFYCIYKITLIVSFIFIDIALAARWLYTKITTQEMTDENEKKLNNRKIDLYIGLLILGEAFPSLGVDMIGVICPPLAYRIHTCLKENITQPRLQKWGIVPYP